ncbi:MAG: hypothetical protein WCC87_16180 [Candidatus Korobacteraceae bacterium]
MADLLLLIAVALPCLYTYRRCVFQGRLEINHVATFSFGFLFYWITPLAVRIFAERLDFPLSSTWAALFREKLIVPYALSCVALYLCFAVGDWLGSRWFRIAKLPRKQPRVPRLVLSLVTAGACGMLVYTALVFRAALLRTAGPGDIPAQTARGAVTAYVILLCLVAIMFTIDRPQISWSRRLRTPYFLLLIVGSALLLRLGSRLYVASFLVMFAVYQSCFHRRFKLRTVIAGGIALALFFGAVGMWRQQGEISGALFNVVEEPMLSSIAVVHHLRYKGIAWINTPDQLGRDFRNLIPTILLPNKFATSKKPDAYTPVGSLNSYVSFNLNFGILGSAVFLLLWPMLFRYLRSRSANTLFATMYVMCSGWLAFTFFRDPFSISLIKAILQDSIIMPALIVAFGWLLSAACAPAHNVGGPLPEPRMETL